MMMNLWIYFLLFAFPFTGGFIALRTGYKNEKLFRNFLSFGGGFIFSITVLNLLPEVFSVSLASHSVFILCGFFFQLLISTFSEGTEHGHLHNHHHEHTLALPVGLFFSLSVHAFTEGIPLGILSGINKPLSFGIGLHELPAAFALMSILQTEHISKKNVFFLLLVYASMSPAGALVGNILRDSFPRDFFNTILAFVAGMFLNISTNILLENNENHRFKSQKLLAVLGGVLIALITNYLK